MSIIFPDLVTSSTRLSLIFVVFKRCWTLDWTRAAVNSEGFSRLIITFFDCLLAFRKLSSIACLPLPLIFFISQCSPVLTTKTSGVVLVPLNTNAISLWNYSAKSSATRSSYLSGFGFNPTGLIILKFLLIISYSTIKLTIKSFPKPNKHQKTWKYHWQKAYGVLQ